MQARRCGARFGLGITFAKPWVNLTPCPCHVTLASESRRMRRCESACCSLPPHVLVTQETDGKMRVGRRAGERLAGPSGPPNPVLLLEAGLAWPDWGRELVFTWTLPKPVRQPLSFCVLLIVVRGARDNWPSHSFLCSFFQLHLDSSFVCATKVSLFPLTGS
ncbi:hypothetical protein E2C01_046518 [Portunus trituberculatus]|uniref:Uncharacterized protein n=1 Tax=Portunus trituberculatus TaxID=210409 RepID=A0A5B7G5Z6_PORTR|nr:hypothetical protein [Portunus trituberculatus]